MRATRQLIGLGLALALVAHPATGGDLRDLYFGEALYHAYQGQYFDALQRLDTELARIHFQKDQLDDAQQALARIKGKVPEEIRSDVEFLRANDYMATGQPGEAVKVLAQLKSNERLAGFVAYNLGIALLQDGRQQEAIEQLNMAGQLPAGDPTGLAIRDKSNLVLGTMLFESGNFERARQSLDRVHLEGPFSNQALLRAGWAED